jgi:hypothetical protein
MSVNMWRMPEAYMNASALLICLVVYLWRYTMNHHLSMLTESRCQVLNYSITITAKKLNDSRQHHKLRRQ